jgi:GNAT superfamily N-acetyltransferase
VTTTPGDQAGFVPGEDPIQIAERSPSGPDAVGLLRALHGEQVARYGFADPAELSPSDYTPPRGVFVIAYQGEVPIGCGGYRWFDPEAHTVELKRAYVVAASRRRGTGRTLLSWLEQHAIAAGARRAILETGARNTAALSLITSAGYQPIERYIEGRDPEINRAFARSLIPGA